MTSADFRKIARDALKGNWIIAIIAAFIASFLGGLNSTGLNVSFNFTFESPEIENNESVATLLATQNDGGMGLYDGIITALLIFIVIAFIYSLIMFIIGSAVAVGYSEFNLDLIDGVKPRIGSLFSRFGQLKTAIAARLLVFLRVFVGLLFFVVPGIIMAYNYSMVNFVLSENPDMTAREALKESKRIMKGYRFKLFCLELSFFGWVLLSVLTFGIGFIWVVPYQQATLAAFYREISNEEPFSARVVF